jgi:transcription elongation factor GreA
VSHLPRTDKVVFGATVALESDVGEEVVFQIVGEAEADVRLGQISITSPIARALVGKAEGDEVDVAVPGGNRTFEIVSVRYE